MYIYGILKQKAWGINIKIISQSKAKMQPLGLIFTDIVYKERDCLNADNNGITSDYWNIFY